MTVLAATRDRYGGPDVVELREMDRPSPVDDQVLVRVVAASVNRADLDLLSARPPIVRLLFGLRRPRNGRLGCDVAGVVESVGADVTRFRPGDRVFADLYDHGLGSFGEFVAAREKAFQAIPEGLSFEDAATLPHSGILAIQGLRLRDGRGPGPGDRVLVVGASGNVGPFAVQIAKHLGTEVTGICRTDKVDFVRSLGADHVIDYTTTDYTTMDARYDWIIDTDSHQSILDARRVLRSGGVYVTLGGSGSRLLQALVVGPTIRLASGKRMGLMLWWKPFAAADIARLAELVVSGTVTPAIDRRYPLLEIVEALRYVDEGRARGKVVITFGSDGTEPVVPAGPQDGHGLRR